MLAANDIGRAGYTLSTWQHMAIMGRSALNGVMEHSLDRQWGVRSIQGCAYGEI